MYRAQSILTVLFFVGSLSAAKTAFAAEEILPPPPTQTEGAPLSETTDELAALRQLAAALGTGGEAVSHFRALAGENKKRTDSFSLSIYGMACGVDAIAYYVSCYSGSIKSNEEASRLYARLIADLQTALASDRWSGGETTPRLESIRSYTYTDRKSDAHIDVDLVPTVVAKGEYSYLVTIFGWAATGPRL
jgi:hypothetical protein